MWPNMAASMMRGVLLSLCLFLASVAGDTCQNPEVTATSYTSQDATVLTNVAFIAEFTLQCSNGVKDLPLYASLSGKTFPVVRSLDGSKYQVSWTEEIPKAYSGDYSIHLYDEDGYAALRKAQRSGEGIASVKPLVTIVVNHPGTYTGPWVSSEFMAAVLAALVSYLALSARAKLLK